MLEPRRVLAPLGAFVDDASDRLFVFDPTSDVVSGWVDIPESQIKGDVEISRDGSTAYVTDFDNNIFVVDLTTSPPTLAGGINPIRISNQGEDLDLTADQRFLVITNGNGCDNPPCTGFEPLSVVDTVTRREVDSQILGDSTPNTVIVTDDGTILAGRYDAQRVHKMQLSSNGQVQYTGEELDVHGPVNIVEHPDGRFAVTLGFNRSTDSGALTSIDISGFQVVNELFLSSSGLAPVAGVFSVDGRTLFTRVLDVGGTGARLQAYSFDSVSGVVGPPLYDVPAATFSGYFGIDQLALSLDGTELLVPNGDQDRIDVHSSATGQLLRSFTADGVDAPTGIRVIDTNQTPVVDAGGPYDVAVGQEVILDASGTRDADDAFETLSFQWDLDGDGRFGETGDLAVRGDEVGPSPTFRSLGIPAGTGVPISLIVTDPRGVSASGSSVVEVGYAPDLTLRSSELTATPEEPSPGEDVVLTARVRNIGLRDTGTFDAVLFDFDVEVARITVDNLAPGQSRLVEFPPQVFEESYRLLTVRLDTQQVVTELEERNNESGIVVKVGDPVFETGDASMVFTMNDQIGGPASSAILVGGFVDYNFVNITGERDYPVQGGAVTVRVLDPATLQPISQFSGTYTDVEGKFRQSFFTPSEVGVYPLQVEVTDGTLTGSRIIELYVTEPSTPIPTQPAPLSPPSGGTPSGGSPYAPTPPGSSGSTPPPDVFVFAEDIVISNQPTEVGETISVGAFVQYTGTQGVNGITVNLNDLLPVDGQWQSLLIATAVVDFPPAPPEIPAFVTVAAPWVNTQGGAHLIQVEVLADQAKFDSGALLNQYRGNDSATRLVNVGVPPEDLPISHQVQLLVDADGNSVPTAGDTLRYVSTIVNNGEIPLTGGSLAAQFDSRLYRTLALQTGGAVLNENQARVDLGTLTPGQSATLTVDVQLLEADEFPAGFVTVRSDVLFESNDSVPVAANSELLVIGDVLQPEIAAAVVLAADPSTAAVPASDGTYTEAITLELRAADILPGSGIDRLEVSVGGAPFVDSGSTTASVSLLEAGTTQIRARAFDKAGNFTPYEITLTVADELTVSEVTINGGAAQRSNVTEVAVSFDQATNLQALIDSGQIVQAVQIVDEASAVLPLTADHFQYDPIGQRLLVDLTVDGFGGSQSTRLADGRYELRLDTTMIESDLGVELSDTDGLVDEVLRVAFHQLTGDFTGDESVGADDRAAWFDPSLVRFNAIEGQDGYNAAFDFDGDRRITARDYYFWLRGLVGNSL